MHLICGEALYDVLVDDGAPQSGTAVGLKAVAGGSPLNVAVGLARLGAAVALASDIARDFLGHRLAAQLAEEGVNDRFLRRSTPVTALALVGTDTDGKPSYSFSGLEQAVYAPPDDAIRSAEAGISGIHLGSIAIVMPNSAAPLLDLARRFADRALVSLDPNIRLAIVSGSEIWHRAIADVRPHCHVIKVSDEDIAALYEGADPEQVCRGWLTDRTVLVVLTKGADGAVMFTHGAGRVVIPPVKTFVADTIGAGDSFMAALLFGLVRNGWVSSRAIASLDVDQLLAIGSFAARAAAVTCSRRGPNLPNLSELDMIDVPRINTAT